MDAFIKINFLARPCRNIKLYYHDYNGKTLLGGSNIYIKDLSELPPGADPLNVTVEWEEDALVNIDVGEMMKAADALKMNMFSKNPLRDVDIPACINFFQHYGCFAPGWKIKLGGKESTTVDYIVNHLYTMTLIRDIIHDNIDMRKLLKYLATEHKKIPHAAINAADNLIITPYGLKLYDGDAFAFRIPLSYMSNVSWDADAVREDPNHDISEFKRNIIDFAKTSVAQYMARTSLVVKSVSFIGKNPDIVAYTENPIAYYLLHLRQRNTNKKERDRNYIRKPYPRLTNYFRSRCRNNLITESQLLRAYDLAKKYAQGKDSMGYLEARDKIQMILIGEEEED